MHEAGVNVRGFDLPDLHQLSPLSQMSQVIEEGGDQQHLVGRELTSQVLPLLYPDPPEGPGL